ncbi:SWI/SNF complex subunit SMARCC2 [Zostera marina]|uniref:SWI/SNF complex subunit SMARCC2 n=1 Tax=Zostera marina TaxID=29655 RepID=A0A0K9NPY4_ZOSMR|nr:SWI/SNF complex subunit SMARCC2 [Zostera marina]
MAEPQRGRIDGGASETILSTIPPDLDLYTIPARSSWFRWDDIHETEKLSIPSFFDSSSISRNPKVYKEYRDFMINKYREDPTRRLTFTEVRKFLIGDAGTLYRVFTFLDNSGLINFSVDGIKDDFLDGDEKFPVIVAEDGPPGAVRVIGNLNVKNAVEKIGASSGRRGTKDGGRGFRFPPLTSYTDVFGTDGGGTSVPCRKCGDDCRSGYYESKEGSQFVCEKCFKIEISEGLKSEDDFMFVSNRSCVNSKWTDDETLHLLEALIAKKNDWDLVSDQARRTKQECIVKLVQLPLGEYDVVNKLKGPSTIIGDKHHAKIDVDRKETLEEDTTNVEPSLKKQRIVDWSHATESLMEQVASLSTIAGPQVAASAAKASIAELCKESSYAKKVFRLDKENNDPESFNEPMITEEFETKRAELSSEKNFSHQAFKVRAAIGTAFGSVAAHAVMLATQEEREIEHLVASIIEMQMKKVQCKIKHLKELESIMETEYKHTQQMKKSILSEWIQLLQMAPNSAGIAKWRQKSLNSA